MRRLYLVYSNSETVSSISKDENKTHKLEVKFLLSWSHYCFLIAIEDSKERSFYEIETAKNNWSVRELKRQYDSALYTRLALSRDTAASN